MAVRVKIPNDFTPRWYQSRPMRYLDQCAICGKQKCGCDVAGRTAGKKLMWVVHRRGGKDLTLLHQTNKMAHRRKAVYWHIYPSFAQARKAIWEGFTREGKRILENVFPGFLDPKRAGSIVRSLDKQQMAIELKCGSIWRLLGSDRIEVVGAGPAGVTYSEYALSNPRARNLIRPMLRENGGWEAYITTPRGKNHAYELYKVAKDDPSWFCEVHPLASTGAWKEWIGKNGKPYQSADEVKNEDQSEGMPEAMVRAEYDCDWEAALVGSVWGDLIEQLEKLGGTEPFNHPWDGVFTTWDLGMTDDTSIWFWQIKDGGVDFIDFYSDHGKPLSHYFDLVDNKPYKYVKHWLPHDARQQHLSSQTTILEQFMRHYPGMVTLGPNLSIVDGIQAGRWMLQQGVRFHPRCADGVESLKNYHYEFDEERKIFSTNPVHDWSSHDADAFRYTATVVRVSEMLTRKPEIETKPKPAARPMHMAVSLNDLFDERESRLGLS